MKNRPQIGYTLASLSVAAILWAFVFLTDVLNFWYRLTATTTTFMLLTYFGNKHAFRLEAKPKHIAMGLLSGLLLYSFFLAGFSIAKSLDIIVQGAENVYAFRTGLPVTFIGLLLLFPISPAEEIFWRGLIQNGLVARLGKSSGYVVATMAYSLVHLPTFNSPLMLVALIVGLVWGALLIKTGSLTPGVVSHITFNEMIFVLLPIN